MLLTIAILSSGIYVPTSYAITTDTGAKTNIMTKDMITKTLMSLHLPVYRNGVIATYSDVPISNNLPEKATIDLNYFPPINSQEMGSCTAWASIYYSASYMMAKKYGWKIDDPLAILSPTYAYSLVNGGFDAGSNFTDMHNALKNKGILPWTAYAADYVLGGLPLDKVAELFSKNIKVYAHYSFISYKQEPERFIKTLKTLLSQGKPAIISVKISTDFLSYYGNGVFTSTQTGGIPHAMTVVGYDDTKHAFLLANSWGTSWGNQGFAWVDYDTFINHLLGSGFFLWIDDVNINLPFLATWEPYIITIDAGHSAITHIHIRTKTPTTAMVKVEIAKHTAFTVSPATITITNIPQRQKWDVNVEITATTAAFGSYTITGTVFVGNKSMPIVARVMVRNYKTTIQHTGLPSAGSSWINRNIGVTYPYVAVYLPGAVDVYKIQGDSLIHWWRWIMPFNAALGDISYVNAHDGKVIVHIGKRLIILELDTKKVVYTKNDQFTSGKSPNLKNINMVGSLLVENDYDSIHFIDINTLQERNFLSEQFAAVFINDYGKIFPTPYLFQINGDIYLFMIMPTNFYYGYATIWKVNKKAMFDSPIPEFDKVFSLVSKIDIDDAIVSSIHSIQYNGRTYLITSTANGIKGYVFDGQTLMKTSHLPYYSYYNNIVYTENANIRLQTWENGYTWDADAKAVVYANYRSNKISILDAINDSVITQPINFSEIKETMVYQWLAPQDVIVSLARSSKTKTVLYYRRGDKVYKVDVDEILQRGILNGIKIMPDGAVIFNTDNNEVYYWKPGMEKLTKAGKYGEILTYTYDEKIWFNNSGNAGYDGEIKVKPLNSDMLALGMPIAYGDANDYHVKFITYNKKKHEYYWLDYHVINGQLSYEIKKLKKDDSVISFFPIYIFKYQGKFYLVSNEGSILTVYDPLTDTIKPVINFQISDSMKNTVLLNLPVVYISGGFGTIAVNLNSKKWNFMPDIYANDSSFTYYNQLTYASGSSLLFISAPKKVYAILVNKDTGQTATIAETTWGEPYTIILPSAGGNNIVSFDGTVTKNIDAIQWDGMHNLIIETSNTAPIKLRIKWEQNAHAQVTIDNTIINKPGDYYYTFDTPISIHVTVDKDSIAHLINATTGEKITITDNKTATLTKGQWTLHIETLKHIVTVMPNPNVEVTPTSLKVAPNDTAIIRVKSATGYLINGYRLITDTASTVYHIAPTRETVIAFTPTTDTTVEILTIKQMIPISVTMNIPGAGVVQIPDKAGYGDTIQYTITANDGYFIKSIVINMETILINDKSTLTTYSDTIYVTEPIDIYVEFAEVPIIFPGGGKWSIRYR